MDLLFRELWVICFSNFGYYFLAIVGLIFYELMILCSGLVGIFFEELWVICARNCGYYFLGIVGIMS